MNTEQTKTTQKRTFTFFNDPGHGWMKVPRKLLVDLGVESKISTYSYQKGDFVYLEEDSDAEIVLEILIEQGVTPVIKSKHTNRQSRIEVTTPIRPNKRLIARISSIKRPLRRARRYHHVYFIHRRRQSSWCRQGV